MQDGVFSIASFNPSVFTLTSIHLNNLIYATYHAWYQMESDGLRLYGPKYFVFAQSEDSTLQYHHGSKPD